MLEKDSSYSSYSFKDIVQMSAWAYTILTVMIYLLLMLMLDNKEEGLKKICALANEMKISKEDNDFEEYSRLLPGVYDFTQIPDCLQEENKIKLLAILRSLIDQWSKIATHLCDLRLFLESGFGEN